VVVSNRAYSIARPDAVIMAITSQLHSPSGLGEVWIGQWAAANLLKPSAIKSLRENLGFIAAERNGGGWAEVGFIEKQQVSARRGGRSKSASQP